MTKSFENNYLDIVKNIIQKWIIKKSRNWITKSLFWIVLEIDCLWEWLFPLLTSRKIIYKGAIWEFAAIIRQPNNINDFKKYWCNYRNMWAKHDWSINIDYWNKWFDFNWYNQIEELIYNLKNNPDDRRLIINAWDPSNLKNLDLPCCHYAYQFYVRDWKLDMIWHQRSADFMVWVPSDIILAALLLITLSNEAWLLYWNIKMVFGDTHIYEEHFESAIKLTTKKLFSLPKFELQWKFYDFVPDNIKILDYKYNEKTEFILKK